jgi:hypothetical protein
MSYAMTISHEKRAQKRDEEDIRVRREERKAYQNLTKEVYNYENYAGPVQQTYDDVIANTLSLLRNLTLDERVHRMQEEVHQKKVWSLSLSHTHCLLSLSPSFSETGEAEEGWSHSGSQGLSSRAHDCLREDASTRLNGRVVQFILASIFILNSHSL